MKGIMNVNIDISWYHQSSQHILYPEVQDTWRIRIAMYTHFNAHYKVMGKSASNLPQNKSTWTCLTPQVQV